jgi:hypothetical protein
MLGFKLFHRQKPRGFNYIPRHYDIEQERLDERRRELLGPDAPSVKRHTKTKVAADGNEMPERRIRFQRGDISTSRIRRQPAITNMIGVLGMLALLAVLCYLFIR